MANENTFIVSDEREVNSYGFRVKTEGIKIKDFEANPVMLLNHNYDKVLGTWKNLTKEGPVMKGEPVFDMEDPEAVKIEKKVAKNLIKGASIGILPLKAVMGVDGIPDVTESELIEITVTPLPSNKGAIKLYKAPGQELPMTNGIYDLSALTEDTNPIKPNTMQKKEFFVLQLGLNPDANEDVILKAVTETVKERNELKVQLEQQKAKIDAFELAEKTAKEKAITDMVTAAKNANKILAVDEAKYIKLAQQDFNTTKEILESLQPKKSIKEQIENGGGAGGDKYADWDFRKLQKDAPKELSRIKEEEPERYKQLIEGLKGQ